MDSTAEALTGRHGSVEYVCSEQLVHCLLYIEQLHLDQSCLNARKIMSLVDSMKSSYDLFRTNWSNSYDYLVNSGNLYRRLNGTSPANIDSLIDTMSKITSLVGPAWNQSIRVKKLSDELLIDNDFEVRLRKLVAEISNFSDECDQMAAVIDQISSRDGLDDINLICRSCSALLMLVRIWQLRIVEYLQAIISTELTNLGY